MAKKSGGLGNEEIRQAIELLKQQAQEQAAMSGSLEGYLAALKKVSSLNKTILENKKLEAKIEEEIKNSTGKDKVFNEAKLKLLKTQTAELEKQGAVLVENIKQVNKGNLMMAKLGATALKSFGKLPDLVKNSYGKLKGLGLFEMDKSIKSSALKMGLLSKGSAAFRADLKSASFETNKIGVGVEELAKIQADYSDALGRNIMLTQQGFVAMSELSKATGLGAEGAAQMASDMENQGLSAERTRDFVEQTMNDSHKMGLNASKVIKNIQNNMKLLNKYNFKGGVKGLAKMAETTTKLGVDMNMVAGMAEKLFDIEGAVDMSAQLQVMGGEWAKLADPFKLMYMARNDMEGLTAAMGKAAEASVHFNKANGEFEISALEMHKLRKVAEQTGVSYEELATAGKNAAKFTQIKKQMSFNVDKETQEFLSTTAQFNDKGEAFITIKGQPKLVKELSSMDKDMLKAQIAEKQSMKERAKSALTFDDALTNTLNMFKTALLPLIEVMNTKLLPKVEKFVKKMTDGKMFDKISAVAETIGNWISKIGGFIIDNPALSAGIAIAAKLTGFIADKLSWIGNGKLLGMGFNSVASAGGGGGLGSALGGGGGKGGGFGAGLKGIRTGAKMIGSGRALSGLGTMAKGLGKASGPLALAAVGIDAVTNAMDDNLSITDKFLKTLDQHKGMAAGAAIGSIVPGIGTAVGAGIGGIVDMFAPEIGEYGKGAHDAVFNKPLHDGKLGSDFSKGRGIIQGGKITPIDNKDDLMAMKPKGPIDKAMSNTPQTMKIEFGDIHFKFDELKVTSPGSPGVAIDLLKDASFIKNITRMVHVETEKVVNGGKVKG